MGLWDVERLADKLRACAVLLELGSLSGASASTAKAGPIAAVKRTGVSLGDLRDREDQVADLGPEIRKLWQQQYRAYEQRRSREQQERVSKRDVKLRLEPSPGLVARYTQLSQWAKGALDALRNEINVIERFARRTFDDHLKVLADNSFLVFCRIDDLARLLPAVVERGRPLQTLEYEPDLLDRTKQSLLITGPAGFGKTSYCRWHALEDARRMAGDQGAPLPIYVRLHQHAQERLGTFEDTFLRVPEVRQLLAQPRGSPQRRHVRLYLDCPGSAGNGERAFSVS